MQEEMVSWLCFRRVWLLFVTVKSSRLWLLDGHLRLCFSSDLPFSASCLALRVGVGQSLTGAASLRFIVEQLH